MTLKQTLKTWWAFLQQQLRQPEIPPEPPPIITPCSQALDALRELLIVTHDDEFTYQRKHAGLEHVVMTHTNIQAFVEELRRLNFLVDHERAILLSSLKLPLVSRPLASFFTDENNRLIKSDEMKNLALEGIKLCETTLDWHTQDSGVKEHNHRMLNDTYLSLEHLAQTLSRLHA